MGVDCCWPNVKVPNSWQSCKTSSVGELAYSGGVDDFDATYEKLVRGGVELLETPRVERYGKVVVFKDVCGNKMGSSRFSRHDIERARALD